MGQVSVVFQPYGKRVRASKDDNILGIAREAGINIRSICGGKGSCGKCRVIIRKGEIDFRYTPKEELLTKEELSQGYALACLTRCKSDCEVLIPPESRIEGQKILSDAVIPDIRVDPAVRKLFISSKQLHGQSYKQLVKSFQLLTKAPSISSVVDSKLKSIAGRCREEGATLTVGLREPKILDIEVGNTSERNFGLAIDVGTTKITVYLVDLTTGKIVGTGSDYNRQLMYGEDLVSRIGYTVDREEGIKNMQRAVIETTNNLVERLTSDHGVEASWITNVCVAGNTVMTYFFSGKDASSLLEPNIQIPRQPVTTDARRIGLRVNPEAEVYCLPCVSRFLGGDAIGDVLLSRMYESPKISLLLDIGTNVEAILGSQGWFLSTTAAAGPAFEGWGIRFGMRSVGGAIDHVKIDPVTLKASYTIIGGARPRGICGSGLIDVMSEMFRNGILDSLGKVNQKLDSPHVRRGEEWYEYVVVPASETDICKDIVITEKDVLNLIDSKAAACSAISVIMKKMNLSVHDVANVYVCGAFANYMDLNSAMAIGLLPEFPKAQMKFLGNGSVAGAYLTLISQEQRKKAGEIASLMAYFDLLKDADFMDEYTAAYMFPGKRELFPTWWEASRKR
ncbi:MAG: hypothetical protein AVW06_04165 [Hadesarchaea archaeon DG-33-1]|nr:MAG: hypothetical protein AVW06_04165 [Hadesarchaea archaeon DG-33-1]